MRRNGKSPVQSSRDGLPSDPQLTKRAKRGDERAFTMLYDRYRPALLRYLYSKIFDYQLAEDLVQETFIRIHRHLDRFRQSSKFSVWAFTIASNLAKNALRNRARRRRLVVFESENGEREDGLSIMDTIGSGVDLERELDIKLFWEMIDKVVGQLSGHYREVFRLREIEGKTYDEMVADLDQKLGTIKSRLCRARKSVYRGAARRLAS